MSSIIDVYDAGFDQQSEAAMTENDPVRPTSVSMLELNTRLNRLLKDDPDSVKAPIPNAKYDPMDQNEADRIRLLAAQYRASVSLPADFLPEKREIDPIDRRAQADKAVKFSAESQTVVNTQRSEATNYIPKRVVNLPAPDAVAPAPRPAPVGKTDGESPILAPPRRQYFMPGAVPLLNNEPESVADDTLTESIPMSPSVWTELEAPNIPTMEINKKDGRSPPRRGDSLQPPPRPSDDRDASSGKLSFFDRILHRTESTDSSLKNVDASAMSVQATTITIDDSEKTSKKKKPKKGSSRRKSFRRRVFGSVTPLSLGLIIVLLLNVIIIDVVVVVLFTKFVPDLGGLQTKVEDSLKKLPVPTADLKIPKVVVPGV